jgi:hypothetical protein
MYAPGNKIELIRPVDVDISKHPILYGIVVAYRHFYGEFTKVNGNYRDAYVFDNPAFMWGPDFTRTMNEVTFGANFYRENFQAIRSLKYSDCFTNNVFKSQAEFRQLGLQLQYAAWMQLRTCILHARDILIKADPLKDRLSVKISDFLARGKGSKKFRKYLDCSRNSNDLVNLRSVRTFYNLVDLPVPEEKLLKNVLIAWNKFTMGNNFREFVFKTRYNLLPLNNRVNAYNDNADPRCSFCRITDPQTQVRESFVHIFLECPITNLLLRDALEFFFELVLTNDEFRTFYWSGILIDCNRVQQILVFFWDIVRYTLFRYKWHRRIPNHIMFRRDVLFYFRTNLPTIWYNMLREEHVLARLYQRLE